jgi:hypothetical protein
MTNVYVALTHMLLSINFSLFAPKKGIGKTHDARRLLPRAGTSSHE